MIGDNYCKKHTYQIYYNAPGGTYSHPNGHKTQHKKERCTKCNKTAWRNNETGKIYYY
jgi:hypothetical protein